MSKKPTVLGMDLEGVLIPEIWIAFSQKTGIEKLSLTTRDINDYDKLMSMRLSILKENNLKLKDIQEVIATLDPIPGANDFVEWAMSHLRFIILSDTFYEFAAPLMAKLGQPTLFCNWLETDPEGFIKDYILRQKDGKRKAIQAFKQIGFHTIAVGDSYNDTTMLKEADAGILFHSPENIQKQFPQFPALDDFEFLKQKLSALAGLEKT